MDLGLRGKVVLITGGAKGIGREAAQIFAGEGAHVAISYLTSAGDAQDAVEALRAEGVGATAVQIL